MEIGDITPSGTPPIERERERKRERERERERELLTFALPDVNSEALYKEFPSLWTEETSQ
jgi:hypothetical protein